MLIKRVSPTNLQMGLKGPWVMLLPGTYSTCNPVDVETEPSERPWQFSKLPCLQRSVSQSFGGLSKLWSLFGSLF